MRIYKAKDYVDILTNAHTSAYKKFSVLPNYIEIGEYSSS